MLHKSRSGFTLVELMLAMAFIAILLVAVTVTTIHLGRLYNQGMTLKTVNQTGRSIMDYLRRDIAAAEVPANFYISPETSGAGGVGRLCLGGAAYVWNRPSQLGTSGALQYSDGTKKDIILARIADASFSLCNPSSLGAIPRSHNDASELLSTDTISIVVHDMQISKLVSPVSDKKNIYRVSMTLGTNEAGTITTEKSCRPPGDQQGNVEYCAVNQFETVVYAGGKK